MEKSGTTHAAGCDVCKAHVPGERKKQMTDKIEFNTEGNETQTSWRTWQLTWTEQEEQNGQLARCKMSAKKKHSIQYAVYVHEGGGELHGMQKLEDGTQEENNFQIRSGNMGTRGGEVARRSSAGLPTNSVNRGSKNI